MATTETTMSSRLAVYGTGGEEFYPNPADGAGHPQVSDWFLRTGLRCYLDTGESKLMVYLGDVRHPTELDQAFAVYDGGGSRRDTIRKMIDEINTRLVEQQGWTLVESMTTTDVKSMYHLLAESTRSSQSQPIQLGAYVDHSQGLIEDVLRSSRTDPLQVLAGDYRTAARLIQSYATISPVRMHIYNKRDVRLSSDIDLAVSVERGQYEVKFPEDSVESLDELQKRRERIQARSRIESTAEKLASHANHDDDIGVVREAVQEGLRREYGKYDIIEQAERERLERELSETQQTVEQQESEIQSLQEELRTKREYIARLESEAAVIERLGTLRQTLQSVPRFFIEPSQSERSEERPYQDSGSNQELYTSGGNRLPGEEESNSLQSRLRWKRIVALLTFLLIVIALSPIGPGFQPIQSWLNGTQLPSAIWFRNQYYTF